MLIFQNHCGGQFGRSDTFLSRSPHYQGDQSFNIALAHGNVPPKSGSSFSLMSMVLRGQFITYQISQSSSMFQSHTNEKQNVSSSMYQAPNEEWKPRLALFQKGNLHLERDHLKNFFYEYMYAESQKPNIVPCWSCKISAFTEKGPSAYDGY